jgi:hypothetical protein
MWMNVKKRRKKMDMVGTQSPQKTLEVFKKFPR